MESQRNLKNLINNGYLSRMDPDFYRQILELINVDENEKQTLIQELIASRKTYQR